MIGSTRSSRPARWVTASILAAFIASCGGSTPPASGLGGPTTPTGSAAPGSPVAGSVVPSGVTGVLPAEVLEAIGDPTPTRLARIGAAFDVAMDLQTGLRTATSTEVADWLTDQRSKMVRASLDAAGVDYSSVGATRLSTERMAAANGPRTAELGALWMGASIGVPFMLGAIATRVGETGQLPLAPQTSHEERTVGDLRIAADTNMAFVVAISGSSVSVDADLSEVATATDTVHGTNVGTSSHRMHIRADLLVCPDAHGVVTLKMQVDITSSTTGALGSTSFQAHATGEQRGQVADDASLQAVDETIDMSYGTTGTNGSTQTGSGQRTFRTVQVPGQGTSVVGATVQVGAGTMTESDSVKWQNFLQMTMMIASQQAFQAAKAQWQGGKCVRIEATEKTRDVDPDALVHFTAKPVHRIEQVDLDKPIVATFSGMKSAIPLDQELDPVASLTFTAGSNTGDQGTVTLKSTSNRGIGLLALTFTVKPPVVYELEIDSTIRLTKIAGLPANAVAKAKGRITLEKVLDDTWRGQGTLISTTTSSGPSCNTVYVSGQGVYDWVVSKVVMSPATAAQDIVVNMDNGTIDEAPDPWTVMYCPGPTLTGTLNTWENPFFLVHGPKDYKSNGFEVHGWTIKGTADTWKTGGLIAEAHWSGTCPAKSPGLAMPGLPAIPAMPSAVNCSEATTFRLYATVPP